MRAKANFRLVDVFDLPDLQREIVLYLARNGPADAATLAQDTGLDPDEVKNALRALKRKAVQTPLANRLFEKNIRRLHKDIQAIDQAIEELIRQDPTLRKNAGLVNSVPGVGLLLTANLMVITSGFNNHLKPRSLAAYLGICPYEHESGSSVHTKPRSDRYGNGKARKLLHLAARSTATHKHNFRAYYLRKLAEGKPKRVALNNIANRLLRIICAVLRDGAPYCETHRSVHPALVA